MLQLFVLPLLFNLNHLFLFLSKLVIAHFKLPSRLNCLAYSADNQFFNCYSWLSQKVQIHYVLISLRFNHLKIFYLFLYATFNLFVLDFKYNFTLYWIEIVLIDYFVFENFRNMISIIYSHFDLINFKPIIYFDFTFSLVHYNLYLFINSFSFIPILDFYFHRLLISNSYYCLY